MKIEHLDAKQVGELIESHGKVKIDSKEYNLILTWGDKQRLAQEIIDLLHKAYMDGATNRAVNAAK